MFLKRIFIFLLLVSVLNQTFNTIGTLVAFQMNRQYITEMLCVNKNRPELQCNGKCVLMQRMQSEVDKAQAKGQHLLQNLIERDIVLFFENFGFNLKTAVKIPYSASNTIVMVSDQCHHQSLISNIFHPPIAG